MKVLYRKTMSADSDLPAIELVRRLGQKHLRLVLKPGTVLVSGPPGTPDSELLELVNEKKAWILKHHERMKKHRAELQSLREQTQGTVLLRGLRKPVTNFPVPGLRKAELAEHEQALVYRYDPLIHCHDDLAYQSLIPAFYRNVARLELPGRFQFWVDKLPFKPIKLAIRNQKTKWGSCSSQGTISLNWRLVRCPQWIADYIIVHELCHLRHFNHSRAFWTTLEHFFPQTDRARAWIHANSAEIFADY